MKSICLPIISRIFFTAIAATFLFAQSTRAGTTNFTFATDPFSSGQISGIFRGGDNVDATALAGVWFPSNGNPDGYVAITQSGTNAAGWGHRAYIVFDDFEAGLVVKAFTFTVDLRIGGGGDANNPADGFSVNYARESDSIVQNPATGTFASSPAGE